ncbi:MAG TPA: hypothetical protein VIQ30_11010 [Pseudonocardia sp.]
MASGVGFKVTGLRETVRALEEIGVEVDDLKDAFQTIANEGAEIGVGLTPEKSGALAGTTRGNRAKSKAVVTWGRASVPYAGVQNYGWGRRNIPAKGFAQATDRAMRPVAISRLENEIDQVIRERGLE